MPGLFGQDLWSASKSLRRLGIEASYGQTADTTGLPLFRVTGQEPDSGARVEEGQRVLVRFNCPDPLFYWDDWVVPLLGDEKNTVSFYAVSSPPQPIRTPGAEYPPELLACQFSGQAKVEVLVDFDGSALAVRLIESSGYPVADSAAGEAALNARFSKPEHNGRPVRVWFQLPYAWTYEDIKSLPGLEREGTGGEQVGP